MDFRIDHIGLVVKDVEKYAAMLSDYLGIEGWIFRAYEPPMLYDQMLDGHDVNHSYKIALAPLKNYNIELLMPLSGESVYSQVLEKNGECFHHICLAFPSEEELEQKKEELLCKGAKISQSGKVQKPQGRGLYYYVEKEGMVLELMVKKN
jgi:methylmalonyl-CoA/ethylmalonyl-CoA epimerase